jgi:hypothetical protein
MCREISLIWEIPDERSAGQLREAQASTIPGHQGRFIQEYIRYIRQISQGQAGKLHLVEHENPVTIRRRLVLALPRL